MILKTLGNTVSTTIFVYGVQAMYNDARNKMPETERAIRAGSDNTSTDAVKKGFQKLTDAPGLRPIHTELSTSTSNYNLETIKTVADQALQNTITKTGRGGQSSVSDVCEGSICILLLLAEDREEKEDEERYDWNEFLQLFADYFIQFSREQNIFDQQATIPSIILTDENAITDDLLLKTHKSAIPMLETLSLFFYSKGDYRNAELLFERLYELCNAEFGPAHAWTKISMANLTRFYISQGDYHRVVLLLKEFYKGAPLPVVSNLDALGQMSCLKDLGSKCLGQGRYDLSELLYIEVLKKHEFLLGTDHPDYLISMSNLADCYYVQDSKTIYDLAEPLYKACLEKRKIVLGLDHVGTLASMISLANLYNKQGNYDLAMSLFEECLEKRIIILGPDHIDTLDSMNNLAIFYNYQGKYDLAESLFVVCLEKRKVVLGPDHVDTLASMNAFANLYYYQGKYDLAEPLYVECLEKRKIVLGLDHVDTLTTMKTLAGLYYEQSKYDLAEPLYKEMFEIKKSLLGPDHHSTVTSMSKLTDIYLMKETIIYQIRRSFRNER